MTAERNWTTTAFVADNADRWAWYLPDADAERFTSPVVGWLTQESYRVNTSGDIEVDRVRVIAAVEVEGRAVPVDEGHPGFWLIVSDDDQVPGKEETDKQRDLLRTKA